MLYTGLSGLVLDRPKYLFPAPFDQSSRLRYYASLFNSIEINSSFYKIPLQKTVSKWASEVPEDFIFTFKLFQEITHAREIQFNTVDVEKFMAAVSGVENKKGCILIQFPPGLGIQFMGQLNKLLSTLNEMDPKHEWKRAVEFRNQSWYEGEIYELLHFYNAALVIHDIPKSKTPHINHQSGFYYLRFHGPTGNYRDSYSEDFLSEYSTYIKEWLSENKEVYVYFNNTAGDAFNNLKTLNAHLGK